MQTPLANIYSYLESISVYQRDAPSPTVNVFELPAYNTLGLGDEVLEELGTNIRAALFPFLPNPAGTASLGPFPLSFRPFFIDYTDITNQYYFFNVDSAINYNSALTLARDSISENNPMGLGYALPSYVLCNGSRPAFNSSSYTTVRIMNNNAISPTDGSFSTASAYALKNFFSWTGCSYSMNAEEGDANSWANTCGSIASNLNTEESIGYDSSTVYVFGSYVSLEENSGPPLFTATTPMTTGSLLYWAMSNQQDNYNSLQHVVQAPELLSYLYSQTGPSVTTPSGYLETTANELLKPNGGVQGSKTFFLPLIPFEDFYQALQEGYTPQYETFTGFGNWINPIALINEDTSPLDSSNFKSVSFMGAYAYDGSYSTFSFSPGQFLFFSSLTGSKSDPGDAIKSDLFLCVDNPESVFTCSDLAFQDSASNLYFLSTSNFWTMTEKELFDSYSVLRGGTAFYSLTNLISESMMNNMVSMTYDNVCQNFGTGLVYAEYMGDIQPQENLTFVNTHVPLGTQRYSGGFFDETTRSNYKQNPNYFKFQGMYNLTRELDYLSQGVSQFAYTSSQIFSLSGIQELNVPIDFCQEVIFTFDSSVQADSVFTIETSSPFSTLSNYGQNNWQFTMHPCTTPTLHFHRMFTISIIQIDTSVPLSMQGTFFMIPDKPIIRIATSDAMPPMSPLERYRMNKTTFRNFGTSLPLMTVKTTGQYVFANMFMHSLSNKTHSLALNSQELDISSLIKKGLKKLSKK